MNRESGDTRHRHNFDTMSELQELEDTLVDLEVELESTRESVDSSADAIEYREKIRLLKDCEVATVRQFARQRSMGAKARDNINTVIQSLAQSLTLDEARYFHERAKLEKAARRSSRENTRTRLLEQSKAVMRLYNIGDRVTWQVSGKPCFGTITQLRDGYARIACVEYDHVSEPDAPFMQVIPMWEVTTRRARYRCCSLTHFDESKVYGFIQ